MKVEIELSGFTPVLDTMVQQYGLVTAAVYGAVWRYAQMDDKICRASLKKIGERVKVSGKTAERHIKDLCANGYLVDITPDIRNKPHSYAVTGKAELSGSVIARSDRESDQGQTESLTRSDRESDQGKTESPLKIHDKIQTKIPKDSSAKADYSRRISDLTLDEIKDKTKGKSFPLGVWEGWLEDEQAERKRSSVIKFIEGKIKFGQLRPVNENELKLFEILATEYDADGGKAPPNKFPSLETKRLFNEASEFHNGTLESVIRKAIHKRGKGIAKIVDYINSPKWQEGQNGQKRTGEKKPGFVGQTTRGKGRQERIDAYLERNEQNMADFEAKMFG